MYVCICMYICIYVCIPTFLSINQNVCINHCTNTCAFAKYSASFRYHSGIPTFAPYKHKYMCVLSLPTAYKHLCTHIYICVRVPKGIYIRLLIVLYIQQEQTRHPIP